MISFVASRKWSQNFEQLLFISSQHRYPANIDIQNFQPTWYPKCIHRDISFHVASVSKITDQLIHSGFGYLACQPSLAMLYQWGVANQKSPVRHTSAAPASMCRTLWLSVLQMSCSDQQDSSPSHGCQGDVPYWLSLNLEPLPSSQWNIPHQLGQCHGYWSFGNARVIIKRILC